MKKALCAMIFSGLMTVGLAGCGGSEDGDDTDAIISSLCEKVDSCGLMSASQCAEQAAIIVGETPTAEQKQAAQQCLAKSCTELLPCLLNLQSM